MPKPKLVHVLKHRIQRNGKDYPQYTVVEAEGVEVPEVPEGTKSTIRFEQAMTLAFKKQTNDPTIVGVRIDDIDYTKKAEESK